MHGCRAQSLQTDGLETQTVMLLLCDAVSFSLNVGSYSLVAFYLAPRSPGVKFHPCLGEVGYVVRLHHAVVVVPWVALWHEERLRCLAVAVYMREVQACVESCAPPAAEHYPAAVAAPVVKTLRVVAVAGCQRLILSGAEV